ncbi:MAG TPA: hypothetical protein VFQ60_05305, partial [Patescibacteria group bacterium]|nr:hypothetical protein [Patescibacteria group bacterium]
MPSSSLENPFKKPKDLDSNTADFFGKVLGSKKKGVKRRGPLPVEDWSGDLVLSKEDRNTIEEEKMITDLMEGERLALRKFFGKEIRVPPLPPEITVKKIKAWEALDLRLHYLPPVSMAEIKRDAAGAIKEVHLKAFPGWKEKPVFNNVDKSKLAASDFFQLPGGWVLVDAREKPAYQKNYDQDFLAPVLDDLNKRGVIKQENSAGNELSYKTRFGLSLEELEKPEVVQAFAKALGVVDFPGVEVRLERCIERNIIGNMYQPTYGDT